MRELDDIRQQAEALRIEHKPTVVTPVQQRVVALADMILALCDVIERERRPWWRRLQ